MKIDVKAILAQFVQREQEEADGKMSDDPKDYLLILSELDDPDDFSAYWFYEIPTGWIFAWDDEKDQEKAVRALLQHDVQVVTQVPDGK